MLYLDYIDLLEIFILSCILYFLLLLLAQDEKKRLLYTFYGYCLSLFFSNILQLNILNSLLIFAFPLLTILALLFHQKTLQKNFVLLINSDGKKTNVNWLDELVKCTLIGLNANKETVYVIQCFNKLNLLIRAPSIFNADLSTDIFQILLSKHPNSPNYLIWLDKDGKLIATNANWTIEKNDEWLSSEIRELPAWKQNAVIISSKSDAIIFKSNVQTRSFDLITKGKQFQNLNTEQLYNLLIHCIAQSKFNKTDHIRSPLLFSVKNKRDQDSTKQI